MTTFRLRACLLALLSGMLPPGSSALAGAYEDALAAFKQRDFATAIRLLQPLADQGNANAQLVLGNAYYGNKDYPEAARWYRRSAEQGNTGAQLNLGAMLETGEGVPRDYIDAYKWLNIAAANERDPSVRDSIMQDRDVLERHLTAEQLAKAQQLASEWKPGTSTP